MRITPNFHFNGECKQALKLYEKAFNAKITLLLYCSDADPSDLSVELSDKEKGYVYHAEMMIGNQRFFFSDSLREIPNGKNISILVTFDNVSDVKAAYDILIDGGTEITPPTESTYSTCFTSLVDRYGMRWELMTENGD
jgi:PhnB protein